MKDKHMCYDNNRGVCSEIGVFRSGKKRSGAW
jgi:hypothetical protein